MINEGNLWSGSELELLVILLEQQGFTWDDIVDHVASDTEAGTKCDECYSMLYSDEYRFRSERWFALKRSDLVVRPTGFPTNDVSEAHENNAAYYERNPLPHLLF